jgi:bifunctional DNA-binding transcriptional regulator/antitoxin component of YhaV-PrlF toxin-antitoxin module
MVEFELPADEVAEVIEPQPFRRLAGIMVGDSVLAIIDMGDGNLQIVRPGQQIPGTEWTVASIDEEKAVLRRSGNKKPKEVVVPLVR